MNNARKPLAGLIALGAALAIPMAFAQDAATQDPTTSAEPTPTTQEATPTPQTTPEATAAQQPLTWADLDADGNGNLSKQEASSVQSLAQVFDDADADSDGQLTPDEYREYVAKADTATPPAEGGGD